MIEAQRLNLLKRKQAEAVGGYEGQENRTRQADSLSPVGIATKIFYSSTPQHATMTSYNVKHDDDTLVNHQGDSYRRSLIERRNIIGDRFIQFTENLRMAKGLE